MPGRDFKINPIQPRQPYVAPKTAMGGDNSFDPLLDLDTGLQNVEGLTQEYYDLWANLKTILKTQQSLGIDPFDPSTVEGQELGKTIMKSISAMKFVGDQLKTGQSIQKAMLPYLATDTTRIAPGQDLNENVTSVQDIQDKTYATRIDPVVKELNAQYAIAVEDKQELDAFNTRLGQEQNKWMEITNDPNATPAERAYAQRQADAVGQAYQNVANFNPYTWQWRTGMKTPEQLGARKTQWWNIVSAKDNNQLYESNPNAIEKSAQNNPHLGVIGFDVYKGNYKIRKWFDTSRANNYGLSDVNNMIETGLPASDRTPTDIWIQNKLDPATTIFTDRDGNRIEPGNANIRTAQKAFIMDLVDKTLKSRLTGDNEYAEQIKRAAGNIAIPPNWERLGVPAGAIIDEIDTRWWGKKLKLKAHGKTVEVKLEDIGGLGGFLYDLYHWNYDYFGFPQEGLVVEGQPVEGEDEMRGYYEQTGTDTSTPVVTPELERLKKLRQGN